MSRITNDMGYLSGGTPALSVDTAPVKFPGMIGQVLEINVGTEANPIISRFKYMKAGESISIGVPVGPKDAAAVAEGDNTVYQSCAGAAAMGIATAAATTGQYFWVQVRGIYGVFSAGTTGASGVVSSGAIVANALVSKNGTSANVVTYPSTFDATAKPFARAVAAAAANLVALWLPGTDT